MRILITGGTGFIGSALLPALQTAGHEPVVLSRSKTPGEADGVQYLRSLDALDGDVDAVINLAGASLAGRRWNAAYKREIVSSRLDITGSLGEYFAARHSAPEVWLNASAIGFYGAQDDQKLTESSPPGTGFSAQLCQDWEAAAADAAGESRLCLMRLGVVLDRHGGAYTQMAQPFRFGLGNWIGSGEQWLSWVHRADVIAAMLFLLDEEACAGVFNLTAPEPVTSRGFCTAMNGVHRTLLNLPMPGPVMRAMVGEMADELLISGQRVLPQRLLDAGFSYRYADLDEALAAIESKAT
jgi:uncharacterized protein (TIGR01777 family)